MADSTNLKRDNQHVDHDPFAELTRIMGHDPRAASRNPQPAEDPFEIDLERELIGGFDDEAGEHRPVERFDSADWSPAAPDDRSTGFQDEAPQIDRFEPNAQVQPFGPQSGQVDLDAEMDSIFAEDLTVDDQWAGDGRVATDDARVFRAAEGIRSLQVDPAPTLPDDVRSGTEFEPAPPTEATWTNYQDDQPLAAVPAHDELDDQLVAAIAGYDDADHGDEASTDGTPFEPRDFNEASAAGDGFADVDMDFGDLELDHSTDREAVVGGDAEWDLRGPADATLDVEESDHRVSDDAYGMPAPSAVAPSDLSLEDELSFLLNDDERTPAAAAGSAQFHDDWAASRDVAEPAARASEPDDFDLDLYEPVAADPVYEPVASAPELAPTFKQHAPQPDAVTPAASRPIFSRANLSGAVAAAASAAYARFSPSDTRKALQPTPEPQHAAPLPNTSADFAHDDAIEDELAMDHQQFEPEMSEYQPPETVEPAPDAFSVFGDIASPPASSVAIAGYEPMQDDLDLDIVDVPEASVAVSDDLDLPDLPVDDTAATAHGYDDLEAEFAEMFQLGTPANGAVQVDSEGGQPSDPDEAFFESEIAAAGLSYGAASGAAGSTGSSYRPHASGMADSSLPEYDPELDQEIALPPAALGASRRPRNGILIAAVVAGVAVLGGIGLFAMGGGDGGSDAPVLVRADTEPMKVRPENPGGTQVPNQDSQAYERAAGGAGGTVPAQESLLSTAEEPVDMAAQVEPEPTAPGITMDGEEETASVPGEKSEDRLTAEENVEGVGAEPDLVAVTPRRVRTMIVRPDGTLVPREEPAPEATAPAASGSLLAAATPVPTQDLSAVRDATPNTLAAPVAPTAPTAATPPSEPASVPQITATAPAAPTARPTPAPAASQPVPTPQAQQQVASAPAAPRTQPAAPQPPAAAAGEWSMQIASQPTAEAAQATYQDLARRYGNVLSGRGVNIVKADIDGRGTYYRVRIPSNTRNDAVSLCERYKAAGGSCFVSR